jgi:PAS domain S-box-containing protein
VAVKAEFDLPADLLEAMADGIIVCDDQGRILFANGQAEQLSGYSREELSGMRIEMLVPERLRDGHQDKRSSYLAHAPVSRAMGSGLDIRFRRQDGTEFAADIALSPLRSGGRSRIVASIRDITERQHANDRLEALREISEAILRGREPEAVLQLVAARARELAAADLAIVVVPISAERLRVTVGAGDVKRLLGTEMRVGASIAGQVMSGRQAAIIPDARSHERSDKTVAERGDLGPLMVVPLMVGDQLYGTIEVGNHLGGRQFANQDLRLVQLFAAQASVALEYGRIRLELQRLAVAEDRERIGREIHDGAIQALFAVGMSLQGAAVTTTDKDVQQRLEAAVEQIDSVIRDLRNYIFGLRPGLLADRALDQALRHLARDTEEKNGVATVVDIDPAVGSRLSNVASDIVQLASEALSNVGRHARAATCRVSLRAESGSAVLEIEDDGTGFDITQTRADGQGLRNLRDRASALGGEMELSSVPRQGTLVRFRIPL